MIFNDRVILATMSTAPDGWEQELTIAQYAKAGERQKYYKPLYAKYRTKKVRDYDLDSGNFIGWTPIQVGIGDPVSYEYIIYFNARTIDMVNNSNVLMARILKRQKVEKL